MDYSVFQSRQIFLALLTLLASVVAHAQSSDQTFRNPDTALWAFRTPKRPTVPTVKQPELVGTPIDAFLLAKLEANGLSFSAEVQRATFVRRAHFDLLGLPPNARRIAEFENDPGPGAFDKLIDELLSSPHYGERWGRHWLDAAGYVDNVSFDGDLATMMPHEGMWRYRDYVIRAFNGDKPFDRFLTEQLAGDELVDWRRVDPFDPHVRKLLVATGYLRNIEDHTDAPQYGIAKRYEVLFGTMDMVSTSLMGLTMECCRCHDHKYDPLTQRDYYRLMAWFEPALNVHHWKTPANRFLADVSPIQRNAIDRHNAQINKKVEGLKAELKHLDQTKDTSKSNELNNKIRNLEAQRRTYGKIQALWDDGPLPVSHVLKRGDVHDPGEAIEPGFPETMRSLPQPTTSPPDARGNTSGRRLRLAQWLTDPNHPLTARVIVNRVWHHHFGTGIVSTPGNFGRSGSGPSHPELLDWLAVDFVESGWSIKRLHRLIMLSTAYRQSSRRPNLGQLADRRGSRGELVDPDNRLLWRMNLRRLEAEIVRDSILAVSGQLNRVAGGPPVPLTTPANGLSQAQPEPTRHSPQRRSIYLFARRVYPLKFLELFDAPIMPVNCTKRANSATVLQSLALLNSEFLFQHADHLATRVVASGRASLDSQVRAAFVLSLGRPPTEAELSKCLSFLRDSSRLPAESQTATGQAAPEALSELCHMLLSTNEFLYVE